MIYTYNKYMYTNLYLVIPTLMFIYYKIKYDKNAYFKYFYIWFFARLHYSKINNSTNDTNVSMIDNVTDISANTEADTVDDTFSISDLNVTVVQTRYSKDTSSNDFNKINELRDPEYDNGRYIDESPENVLKFFKLKKGIKLHVKPHGWNTVTEYKFHSTSSGNLVIESKTNVWTELFGRKIKKISTYIAKSKPYSFGEGLQVITTSEQEKVPGNKDKYRPQTVGRNENAGDIFLISLDCEVILTFTNTYAKHKVITYDTKFKVKKPPSSYCCFKE